MTARQIIFGRDGIKKLIAYREPILFLDRVTMNAIGVSLDTESDSFRRDWLQLLEAMGQASALLICQVSDPKAQKLLRMEAPVDLRSFARFADASLLLSQIACFCRDEER